MKGFLYTLIICLVAVSINILFYTDMSDKILKLEDTTNSLRELVVFKNEATISPSPISKLDAIMLAIMEVESEMNPFAVNEKSGASGILQIMPIYVKECNRLLGEERYNMDDTKSIKYSIEMFRLINKHKNPENSLMKAIKIHNPRGGKAYERKVVRAYNKVLVMDNIVKINT